MTQLEQELERTIKQLYQKSFKLKMNFPNPKTGEYDTWHLNRTRECKKRPHLSPRYYFSKCFRPETACPLPEGWEPYLCYQKKHKILMPILKKIGTTPKSQATQDDINYLMAQWATAEDIARAIR